ncbi:MAG: hypothetical protein WCS27_00350 [Victivallaceae bacterium]
MKLLFLVLVFFVNGLIHGQTIRQFHLPMSADREREEKTNIVFEYTLVRHTDKNIAPFFNVLNIFWDSVKKNEPSLMRPFLAPNESFSPTSFKHIHANIKRMEKVGPINVIEAFKGKSSSGDSFINFIWGAKPTANGSAPLLGGSCIKKTDGKFRFMKKQSYSLLMIWKLFISGNSKTTPKINYPYSLLLKDNVGNNCVTIHFKGKQYNDIDISNISNPKDKILTLYKQFYTALKSSNKPDEYSKLCTGNSAKKTMDGYKRMPSQYEYFRKYQLENPKIITFIINAEPFWLVFYKYKNSKKQFVGYDYIVDVSGELKFTNIGRSTIFDYLLKNSINSLINVVYGDK